MAADVPLPLAQLFAAEDGAARDAAWDGLVEAHSDLLLSVARSLGGGHDAAMDRYAHMLEQLRRDNFRRLRQYVPSAEAKFTTWLVVVARRLCLDQMRQRYGRNRSAGTAARELARARRWLNDLSSPGPDVREVPDPAARHPLGGLAARHGAACLEAAVAALEDDDRLLLRLRFEDDLPAREIATLMQLPTVFHAYRRLNAVLARLRTVLEEAGVEDSRG